MIAKIVLQLILFGFIFFCVLGKCFATCSENTLSFLRVNFILKRHPHSDFGGLLDKLCWRNF